MKFRVAQHADLPPGTEIRNTAAIYFDNNDPVITNQTLHTIGRDFILLGSQQVFLPAVQVRVAPNPMYDRVQVQVKGLGPGVDLYFRLVDQIGRVVLEQQSSTPVFSFDAGMLPGGMYFYELWGDGQLVATGKLVGRN